MRDAIRLFAIGCCLAAAGGASAQISVDFRPEAPGSDELVMEWVAAPGVTGPFHLLRRELAPGQTVADLDLPLDPTLGRRLENVTSPLILSRGVEAFGEPGLRVYQVVSEDGACSQFAYVLKRTDALGEAGVLQQSVLGLPWRGGVRTAAGLFEEHPGLTWIGIGGPWMTGLDDLRRIVRGLDGRPLRADEWIPQGAGVFVQGADLSEVVVVGAAETSPRPVPAAGYRTGSRNLTTLSPRFGQPPMTRYEAMCGREGVDWTDANGDGLPDECPGPLVTPGSGIRLSVTAWDSTSGWSGVAVIFVGAAGPHFVGIGSPVLAPTDAFGANANKDPSEPEYPPRSWLPDDLAVAPACLCADTDGDGTDDCTEELIGTDPLDPASRGPDHDRDGVPDDLDLCPNDFDPLQPDADGDGLGDDCDPCPAGDPACEDPDGDGIVTPFDNCPFLANADPSDFDNDGIGGGCDNCSDFFWPSESDLDADGVGDGCDNCVLVGNSDQGDLDGDGFGDACDLCPELASSDNVDADADGFGDPCDCAPNDPTAVGEPAARADLRMSHFRFGPGADLVGLLWEDSRAALGDGTRWSVARSGIDALWSAGLAASAECWEPLRDEPDAVDLEEGSWWYAVRAFNACGASSWGPPGLGSPLDSADPCP